MERQTIILLAGSGEVRLVRDVKDILLQELPGQEIGLKGYEAEDWDGEYSPWKYTVAGRCFEGRGSETLKKIQALKQELKGEYGRLYIVGYSLAGLFALWAAKETDWFDGCACCSGSLWFEGWEEYSRAHPLKKPSKVYLSLGGKEENARNPLIAQIGDKTRREEKRLAGDTNVTKHILVMNPGGHFASPEKRLAKGIMWLITE